MIPARLARSLAVSAVVLLTAVLCAAGLAAQTQVTPDNGSLTVGANLPGQTAIFTVSTGLQTSQSRTLTVSCSGNVASCSAPGSVTFVYSTNVTVTFSSLAPGSGSIVLTASGGTSDQGNYNVTVQGAAGIAVTPDGQIAPTRFTNGTGYSETFTVQNTGTGTYTYSFTCAGAGGVICGTVPAPVTLNPNATTNVSMPYSVGATAGTGTLTLTGSGGGASNPGSYSIPIAVSLSSVTGGSFTKDTRFLLVETANSYDGYGRIMGLTDARNEVTNYSYGGNSNNAFLTQVTQVHDASGSINLVTNVAYNPNGFVSSIQDPGGSFRYFAYDSLGRLRQVKNNAGTVVKAYGYTYSRTSANGWTYQASSPNAVVDSTFLQTSISVVSTGFIDGLGRSIQSVVQDGTNYYAAATQYDAMGRTWRAWKPFTRTTSVYDPSFSTDATAWYNTYLGVSNAQPVGETQYRTDDLGRVTKVIPEYTGTTPVSTLTAYGVDATAKQTILDVADESGNHTRSYADLFGNSVKSILGYGSADATTTTFTYDVVGHRTQTTDPRGLITTYTFDTRGLLSTRVSPDAGTSNFKYDAAANPRFTQDANQAAAGTVYFTNYDFAGRALNSGLGTATFSSLNPDGSQTSLETTTGNWLVVRAYDARPATANFPWSLFSTQITATTLANVSGRLAAVASKSNGAWQVTLFSYDTDGQIATRFTYTQANGGGSVLTAINTTTTYTRDLRGSLTQRALTVGSSTFYQWYDYNPRGLLWKLSASTSSTKPGTPDVTDTYQPSGVPSSYQFSNGTPVPITYTIREQTSKIGDPTVITYPFSARYVYRPNGTVDTAEFYSGGSPATRRYRYAFGNAAYDALNRLKSADYSSWSGTSWTATLAYDLAGITYDADGNIKTLQRYRQDATLIDNLTYSYPSASNRLSSVNDAVATTTESWDAETGSFTYDANGNVITAPAPYSLTAATYDPANLPLSITRNGATTNYRYDAGGERIAKQTGTGNTDVYLREGATTLGVFTVDGSGSIVSSYFNLLWSNRVVGRQPSTGTRDYYHFDILGTTRSVTQGATIIESHDYDPWGLEMPARGLSSGTKEAFGGKEQDAETGLDYFEARYYMSAIGLWTSPDPMHDRYSAWSPFVYVLDNPVANSDPDGLQVTCYRSTTNSICVGQIQSAGECKSGAGGQCSAAIMQTMAAYMPHTYKELEKAFPNQVKAALIGLGVGKVLSVGAGAILPKVAPGVSRWLASRGSSVTQIGQALTARGAQEVAAARAVGVATRQGMATQELSSTAMAARDEVAAGREVYRGGTFGSSDAGEGQYWSFESPTTPGYAGRVGAATLGAGSPDYVIAGRVASDASFVTRTAPAFGVNAGGATEVVVPAGSVRLESFHMP
jgi:RHS repeat-associated protein